jgi:hypothetical protein
MLRVGARSGGEQQREKQAGHRYLHHEVVIPESVIGCA